MNFLSKIHNISPQIGASYVMLDITGLNIGDYLAGSPQLAAVVSVVGKFTLSLIAAYIVRRIDNYYKLQEINAQNRKP